jgi:hypothetical protein
VGKLNIRDAAVCKLDKLVERCPAETNRQIGRSSMKNYSLLTNNLN